jgi:hypothetical protein
MGVMALKSIKRFRGFVINFPIPQKQHISRTKYFFWNPILIYNVYYCSQQIV